MNVLDAYPRDELFQIDVRDAGAFRPRHPAAHRAAARPGAGPSRRVRPLRLDPRLHPEGPLRHHRAPAASASSWPDPSWPRSRPPIRPIRKGRLSRTALHHRPRRGRDAADRPRRRSKPASTPDRTHLGRRPEGCARRPAAPALPPRALAERYADGLRRRLSRALLGHRGARTTSTCCSSSRPSAAARVSTSIAARRSRPRAPTSRSSRGAPIALSARVPVLENMGFRVVNERTYNLTPQPAAGADEAA